jgi:hypothetical protein
MKLQQLVAVACIVSPISLMLCMGCGIILLPIEAPKVLITNAQTIQFHVDIKNERGESLDDVAVTIDQGSLKFDALIGDRVENKPDAEKLVSGSLDYKTTGHFAVWVTFRKPGYLPLTRLYANRDHLPDNWPVVPNGVNVKKHPVSDVVLLRSHDNAPAGMNHRQPAP